MLVGGTARKTTVARTIRACGRSMFLHLFTAFESTYHRQEIVGKLMTHIGSGSKDEINTALSVFVTMVDGTDEAEYIDLLCPFSAFLKCLIDYVEHLSLGQVRKIFYVLCTMDEHTALKEHEDDSGNNGNSSGDAELNILLRKLLASTQTHYRSIGIVAGSAMVLAICSTGSQAEGESDNDANSQDSNRSGSQVALSPQNTKAVNVLKMMLNKGNFQIKQQDWL